MSITCGFDLVVLGHGEHLNFTAYVVAPESTPIRKLLKFGLGGIAHIYVSPSQEKAQDFWARSGGRAVELIRIYRYAKSASRPMIPASSRTTHPFAV